MSKCISETNGHVVCTDDGSPCQFKVRNRSRVSLKKYEIDGCLIPRGHKKKKCDFGVEAEEVFWIVELKGADFSDAIDQIISTIENFDVVPQAKKITPVVISTKSPLSTYRAKNLKRLAKCLGQRWSGDVIFKTLRHQVTI